MKRPCLENRRGFLKASVTGGLAAFFAGRFQHMAQAAPITPAAATSAKSQVVLTTGNQRAANVFNALRPLARDIALAIGTRRIVIKPNNVWTGNQLSSTHVDALIGILDFLKAINKLNDPIIAESSASNTQQCFRDYNYAKLVNTYNVKLVDLDLEAYQTLLAFSEKDAIPHPIRVSSILSNQKDNFIISACMLKTHDRAVCTMGIKNIIQGAPLKFGSTNDKPIMHGDGYRGINVNLAMLAPFLHPSLTVIDGFQGMQGDGPINGSAVNHKVCVASLDYLAADIVGANLMGINPSNVGYLTYLSSAHVGESNISNMNIIGNTISKLAKTYTLHSAYNSQLIWKTPAAVVSV